MDPTARTAHAAAARPSRLLVILAAAWMIASLTIGGMVTADLRGETVQAPTVTRTTAQP
jgi:hypothetical protein